MTLENLVENLEPLVPAMLKEELLGYVAVAALGSATVLLVVGPHYAENFRSNVQFERLKRAREGSNDSTLVSSWAVMKKYGHNAFTRWHFADYLPYLQQKN